MTTGRGGAWAAGALLFVGAVVSLPVVLSHLSHERLRATVEQARAADLPTSLDAVPEWLDEQFGPMAEGENAIEVVVLLLTEIERVSRGVELAPEAEGGWDGKENRVPEAVRSVVARLAPRLEALDRVLAARRFRISWSGDELQIPSVHLYMHVAYLVVASARIHIEDGAHVDALRDIGRLDGLQATLVETPIPLTYLVRARIVQLADDCLRALALEWPDGKPMQALVDSLPTLPRRTLFDALAVEAAYHASASPRVRELVVDRMPWWIRGLDGVGLLGILHRQDAALLTRHLVEMHGARHAGLDEQRERMAELDQRIHAQGSFFLRTLWTGYDSLMAACIRGERRAAITRAGLEALQYRRIRGSWPEDLAGERAPSTAPVDPVLGTLLVLTFSLDGGLTLSIDAVEPCADVAWTIR